MQGSRIEFGQVLLCLFCYLLGAFTAGVSSPNSIVPGSTTQTFASLPQLSTAAYYVAPNGSDTNAGTIDAPFLTLEKARDTVRGATVPTTVYLRGGEYLLGGSLEFTSLDSGTLAAPITYQNYPGEVPHIRASRKVPLPNGSAGTQVVLPLASFGIAAWELSSWWALNSIWLEDTRLDIARTPNRPANVPNLSAPDPWAGFYHLTDASAPADCTTGDGTPADDVRRDRIRYTPADFSTINWALSPVEQTQVQVFGGFCNYQNSAYWQNLLVLDDIDTINNDFILGQGAPGSVVSANASYPIGPYDRFVLSNHLAFLDADGEWFRDRTANTLTVNVPAGTPDGSSLFLNRFQHVIRLNETAHLTFQGIRMSGAAASCIRLENSTHVTLRGNHVSGCDGTGILMQGDVENTLVEDNHLERIEGVGIHVEPGYGWNGSAWVPRTSPYMLQLSSQNIMIRNNWLEEIGFEGPNVNGAIFIGTGAVGVTAQENEIHTVSRIGVASYGPLNTITRNRITNSNLTTADAAGIYTNTIHTPGNQRSWLVRGNVITENIVENGGGYAYDYSAGAYRYGRVSRGIFLDDYSSGATVARNWLSGRHHECIFLHGGRDNMITDNICDAPNTPQQQFNTQTNAWTDVASAPVAFQEIGPYCPGGSCDPLYPELANLASLGFTSDYLTTFPDVATLLARGGEKVQGAVVELNTLARNILFYPSAVGAWYFAGPSAVNTSTNTIGPNLVWAGSSRTPTVRGRVGPGPTFPTYHNPPGLAWSTWQSQSNEGTGILADPLFTNQATGDYSLQAGSPALNLGIVQLNPQLVGLRATTPAQPSVSVSSGVPGASLPVTITDGSNRGYTTVNREYRVSGGNATPSWQAAPSPTFSLLTAGLNAGAYTLCVRTTSDARIPASWQATSAGPEGCSSFTLANVAAPSPSTTPSIALPSAPPGALGNGSTSTPPAAGATRLASPPATLVQTGPLAGPIAFSLGSLGLGVLAVLVRRRLLRR